MNQELPDVQTGFRKGRGTKDQIANIHQIIARAREFQKTPTSASLTMRKSLSVWLTTNWKMLKNTGIPDHVTCLQRNLYAGQEVTETVGWLKIEPKLKQMASSKLGQEYKTVHCHPAYFT